MSDGSCDYNPGGSNGKYKKFWVRLIYKFCQEKEVEKNGKTFNGRGEIRGFYYQKKTYGCACLSGKVVIMS